ncbi:MAG: peptidase M19 [Rhodospirillaceae bacterium]|nr:peptidase M19 [Rhodospirillaceae bacterium]|tara:strand:- start:15339 stop:16400 length:1062 start_codon:yes stop_codon:yes gene_type:complete
MEGGMTTDPQVFHDGLIVVDGCTVCNHFQCSYADPQVYNVTRKYFQQWVDGGVTMAHVTVATWEDARETLNNITRWNRVFRDHGDLVLLATSAADIRRAKAEGKTAVVMGFQNASPFETDLGLVEVFHKLGVRFAQTTYNIQNHLGGSCYDPVDGGLTRFGTFVLGEMNRLGMVMDVSHVGERTALDCIEQSSAPVVATHANPLLFFEHKRNKSDDLLRALAGCGGMIGLATYPALCPKDTALKDWCTMVARTVDIMGIDHVGIGTDYADGWTTEDAMTINMWRWSHEADYGAHTKDNPGWDSMPDWWPSPAAFSNLTAGLLDHGFAEDEVAAIMGGNWMRIVGTCFGSEGRT